MKGVPCSEVTFSGSNLNDMANTMLEVVESGRLEIYDDYEGRMRRDLNKLSIVEKSYGYKLEAVSDEFGHADVGIALAICLPRAVKMVSFGLGNLQPDDVIFVDDDTPLTDEELKDMPEHLREIYEMYDESDEDFAKENDLMWGDDLSRDDGLI